MMTAALTAPAETPAPVLGHHTETVDGKPQYFHDHDDYTSAFIEARDIDSSNDLTPVTGLPVLHGPELTTTAEDRIRSARIITRLQEYINQAGGLCPITRGHHHFPHVFPPGWFEALDLPSRSRIPVGQAVTLAGPGFTRYTSHAAMLEDYRTRPRTWVFECAHWYIPWLNHAARQLTALTGSRHEVLAAVYDSRAADLPSAPHTDAWYSAIIHVEGAKQWTIGPDRQQVTTEPGDILLIPEGLIHAVRTPGVPGHSRHLVFDLAIRTTLTSAP